MQAETIAVGSVTALVAVVCIVATRRRTPVEKVERREQWVTRPAGHLTLQAPPKSGKGILARIRPDRKAARP
jgi:hypothetical protein